MNQWIELVLLFFIYSFIGWLWETVYCSLRAGKFMYRGFLTGPYCPIYGFGILGVLYFLEPFKGNLILLYFLSALLVTVLEYLTSFVLEKLFHASWWDYKDVPLNINGRVALPVSAFWGLACVLIVRIIHPKILLATDFLTEAFGWILPAALIAMILIDLIYTVTNMQAFKHITDEINTVLETKAKEISESMNARGEVLSEDVAELKKSIEKGFAERTAKSQSYFEELKKNSEITQRLQRLNLSQRRWIKNYPNLKLKRIDNSETVKQLITSIKKRTRKM
ncbi:putative ABC transporter permease [Enterococcus sp. LJL51]|uniref:putative ABC transporter permease n=1 Tax=Enterococcus sp. LJL51 TaxID=3416656 RepID=UPI003CED8880